jgi:AraC family transcriptional regulator
MVLKLQAGVFYGATTGALNLSGFRFTEKTYAPQSNLPRHAHELAHFCFVISGNYTEEFGSKGEERTPTVLIFYPPDVAHAERHHTSGRHFLIELDPWRAASMRDYGLLMNDPAAITGAYANWSAARLYQEFRNMDELSTLALEALAMELMVETLRCRAAHIEHRPPKWFTEAKQILQDNFAAPPSLGHLAKTVGVHPVHLVRVFRKFQHCTVSEHIRQLRIEYACQRMLSSDEPLVEIALSAGFADHTHFSRSFRRVTGMTPHQFRHAIGRR